MLLIVFILARTMVVYTLDCPCGFCGSSQAQGQHKQQYLGSIEGQQYTISTLIHYTSVSVLTCWSHECVGQYAPLAERRVVGEGCTWGPGEECQGMTV